jgi:sirohydrochlorin cobaltochelatase
MDGIVLFAHGARDPRWAAPFEAVAARLRGLRPEAAVRLAYLELMTPDLPDAVRALVDELHCTQVAVLPLFLGAGGHVRKDLPALVERLREAHPQVRFTLHPPAGEDTAVIDALAAVAAAALPSNDRARAKDAS